jgi:Endonuclease-reverse transcriptase
MRDTFTILSANMNRSNDKLTALLETTDATCLLIQEPWWGSLVPRRSDTDPDGEPSLGTVANPKWTAFCPPSTKHSPHPRVVTFIRKDLLTSFTAVPIPHLLHYDFLGLALEGPGCRLHILNFYHHVQRYQGNLLHLLQAGLDHSVPIVLGGDFNTHFELWSPQGKKISPWAAELDSWLDTEGFLSTVPEDAISRVSSTSRPSLIDFIFVNEAFLEVPTFPSTCSVSFALSLGSDHAALLLPLPIFPTIQTPPRPPGWIIDTSLKEEWITLFRTLPSLTLSCTHAFESYVLIGHESALFHVSTVSPRFPDTFTSFSLILPHG